MQVAQLLKQPPGAGPALGAQDASMLVWALAVLHELDPDIWTALLDVIAAAPADSLDEVCASDTLARFASCCKSSTLPRRLRHLRAAWDCCA